MAPSMAGWRAAVRRRWDWLAAWLRAWLTAYVPRLVERRPAVQIA